MIRKPSFKNWGKSLTEWRYIKCSIENAPFCKHHLIVSKDCLLVKCLRANIFIKKYILIAIYCVQRAPKLPPVNQH